MPVNVMVMDGVPSNDRLTELGVSRISYGPIPYIYLMAALQQAKDAREALAPNPEQLEAFREFCRRHDAAVPSLESLTIVAYRHLAAGTTGTGGPA